MKGDTYVTFSRVFWLLPLPLSVFFLFAIYCLLTTLCLYVVSLSLNSTSFWIGKNNINVYVYVFVFVKFTSFVFLSVVFVYQRRKNHINMNIITFTCKWVLCICHHYTQWSCNSLFAFVESSCRSLLEGTWALAFRYYFHTSIRSKIYKRTKTQNSSKYFSIFSIFYFFFSFFSTCNICESEHK